MSEYSVELKGLNKVYSNLLKEDTVALKDINLQIRPGEFISIIGPSGCGKSTLLRIIGNLDKPTSGTIEYRDGADQQMGFVFQDSVLLPWKNVRQNAEFPLVIQKKQTEENEKKLDELLELAGLSEFKTALPRELSGGMKQRVSIARAYTNTQHRGSDVPVRPGARHVGETGTRKGDGRDRSAAPEGRSNKK